MMTVEIDTQEFFKRWKLKEAALGRPLTLGEASDTTGLAPETIRNIRDGKTTRFDASVLKGLCDLLDAPEGPVPFLVYRPETKK